MHSYNCEAGQQKQIMQMRCHLRAWPLQQQQQVRPALQPATTQLITQPAHCCLPSNCSCEYIMHSYNCEASQQKQSIHMRCH
jgi:hypothetical protein